MPLQCGMDLSSVRRQDLCHVRFKSSHMSPAKMISHMKLPCHVQGSIVESMMERLDGRMGSREILSRLLTHGRRSMEDGSWKSRGQDDRLCKFALMNALDLLQIGGGSIIGSISVRR